MKIVYMGTPDFAVPALDAMVQAGFDVELVVTKPDRPKDRGKKLQSCPVKLRAEELGIATECPEKVKGNEDFEAKLKAIAPDFICVAAYGKILPPSILEIPKYGCVNIHGSLLPRYRGPAPIHHAILNGEAETGITLMYMAEGMDTGDMIAKAKTSVGNKTVEEMHIELAQMGAKLLAEYLPKLMAGEIKAEKQDESLASYAPMVFKEDGIIDWTKDAKSICCLVRAFNSWPLASTKLEGEVMKVYEAVETEGSGSDASAAKPGQVISSGKQGIEVACGSGRVLLKKIQLPGKKAMEAESFLLGHKIENGIVLG